MKTYAVYLNGELVRGGEALDVINPGTGEPFAKMATLARDDVAAAIGNANEAFAAWRSTTAKARGGHLRRVAAAVTARGDEIARLMGAETGKPLEQARAEVAMSVDHLEWFAEECRRTYGRIIPHQVDGKRNLSERTPVGVVAAISPWNFPLMLAVRKVAPALAAGCPVILKPARLAPLSCAVFAECVHEAGLPKGVFQLVCGPSEEFGAEFLSNPRCRKVTFTGSTEVGRWLIRAASETVKPLSLELGGQAAALVFADADMRTAVEGVLAAKMRNTGQSCIAANRIYVEGKIYRQFLGAFTDRVRSLKVGMYDEPDVDIGPLIEEAAVSRVTSHIDDAVGRGARLLCGGGLFR